MYILGGGGLKLKVFVKDISTNFCKSRRISDEGLQRTVDFILHLYKLAFCVVDYILLGSESLDLALNQYLIPPSPFMSFSSSKPPVV